jgi:hypothetical protein
MGANPIFNPARILLCWTILFPLFLAGQVPQPVGKLQISSATAGATITINGVLRKEVTPVTLAVSPGDYKVLIGSCAEQTVRVTAGESRNVSCAK